MVHDEWLFWLQDIKKNLSVIHTMYKTYGSCASHFFIYLTESP